MGMIRSMVDTLRFARPTIITYFFVIASVAKQSICPLVVAWIASSLRSSQ
jgi:hypothetical protein